MALGDIDDFRRRLRKLLPYSWFPSEAPYLFAVLTGFATVASAAYAKLKYARAQMRMQTTSDAFLDIAAFDFFGIRIRRRANEQDDPLRARIIKEIFRERVTREGIIQAVTDLTGQAPQFVEPWNTGDVGAISDGSIALAGSDVISDELTAIGFSALGEIYAGAPVFGVGGSSTGAGCIGSTNLPYQVFIVAYRPTSAFVAINGQITDADIYDTIYQTAADGVTAWVWIQDPIGT